MMGNQGSRGAPAVLRPTNLHLGLGLLQVPARRVEQLFANGCNLHVDQV